MLLNAVLHWAVARSIFLVQFDLYPPTGIQASKQVATAIALKPVGILIAVIIGGVLIMTLFGLACVRLPPGMPMLGTCSLAISAACHPPEGDDMAEHELLMYGVIDMDEEESDQEEEKRPKRVTFTSWNVTSLKKGQTYSAIYKKDKRPCRWVI